MSVSFMLTDQSLTVQFNDGSVKTIASANPHFAGLVGAIKQNKTESEIKKMFDLAEAVRTFSDGNVDIKNGEVFFKGTKIENSVSRRILDFMAQGLPWKPLAKFLENLMANPSRRAVEYLYNFLEYGNLAITNDGHFLAYKAVRNDWTDKHSGKFSNLPGATLSMERNQVCDDPDLGCSYGFHVGSLEYVRDFACGYGDENGDRIVIVKTNPADVVSVPHDCEYQKVRTAKYQVLGEYTGPLPEYVPEDDDCGCEEEEDDDRDVHVEADDEEFHESYFFTAAKQDGTIVRRYQTDSYEDEVLWKLASESWKEGLKIFIHDQDGYELTNNVKEELLKRFVEDGVLVKIGLS